MYPLKANPTMLDVIARSAICHPTLLRDALLESVHVHVMALSHCHDPDAKRAVRLARDVASRAAAWIGDGETDPFIGDFSARIAAFSAAARLQLIPPHVRQEIAARDDAARAEVV